MTKETVEALVAGGKATAAPPLGPALGPLGVNISDIVAEINKMTASFGGMQVPVKVTVDTDTKEFSTSIGTPPTSSLLKKEAEIKKGSGNHFDPAIVDCFFRILPKIRSIYDIHGDSEQSSKSKK